MNQVETQTPIHPGLFVYTVETKPGDTIGLLTSRCHGCERHEFPPATHCPGCGSQSVSTVELSSQASVGGSTTVMVSPPGAMTVAPYTVVVAQFPEGVSILGLAVGDPGDVEIGSRIQSVACEIGGKLGFAFRVVDGAITSARSEAGRGLRQATPPPRCTTGS